MYPQLLTMICTYRTLDLAHPSVYMHLRRMLVQECSINHKHKLQQGSESAIVNMLHLSWYHKTVKKFVMCACCSILLAMQSQKCGSNQALMILSSYEWWEQGCHKASSLQSGVSAACLLASTSNLIDSTSVYAKVSNARLHPTLEWLVQLVVVNTVASTVRPTSWTESKGHCPDKKLMKCNYDIKYRYSIIWIAE